MSENKLIVTARFTAGQYNATGERGAAEWPPSPDRLLAAFLSVAPDSEQVRAAYALPAPVIITPPHGVRDSDYSRWVPIQVGLKPSGVPEDSTKNLRAPEKGTLVDPTAEVTWVFDDGAHLAPSLANVAARVSYLGRPTSPAIITVTAGEAPAASDGHTVWQPAPAGNHRVSVPSVERLAALDAAYEASVKATHGTAPALMVGGRAARTFARYLRVDPEAPARYDTATEAAAAEFLATRQVMGVAGAPVGPGAARCLIDSLREAGATEVYPVIAFDPHLQQDRLLGAIVSGTVQDTQVFAYDHIADVRERAVPSKAFISAAKRAASSSDLWTTSAPVAADTTRIRDELAAIASAHDVEIVAAAAHPEDAVTGWQTCDDRLDLTHVSVRFSEPVTGPLTLAGATLLPRRDDA